MSKKNDASTASVEVTTLKLLSKNNRTSHSHVYAITHSTIANCGCGCEDESSTAVKRLTIDNMRTRTQRLESFIADKATPSYAPYDTSLSEKVVASRRRMASKLRDFDQAFTSTPELEAK